MVLLPSCLCCGTCNTFPVPQSIELDIESPEIYYWWEDYKEVVYSYGTVYARVAEAVYLSPITATISLTLTAGGFFLYEEPRYAYIWDYNQGVGVKTLNESYSGGALYPYMPEVSVYGSATVLRLENYSRRAYLSLSKYTPFSTIVPSRQIMSASTWNTQVQALEGFQDLNYGHLGLNPWSISNLRLLEFCDGSYGSVAGKTPAYVFSSLGYLPLAASYPNGCGLPLVASGVVKSNRQTNSGTLSTNAPAGTVTHTGGFADMAVPYTVTINEMRLVYPDGSYQLAFGTDKGASCYS